MTYSAAAVAAIRSADQSLAGLESEETRQRLDHVHGVFTRWLGQDYDLHALDAVLAAPQSAARTATRCGCCSSSGSGNAKTETVTALAGDRRTHRLHDHQRGCAAVGHREGKTGPGMPPAGCCANSATAACSSSRT